MFWAGAAHAKHRNYGTEPAMPAYNIVQHRLLQKPAASCPLDAADGEAEAEAEGGFGCGQKFEIPGEPPT